MQGVASQVQKIRKTSESGKVAVVPITDVIETFNTLYTLPKKVEHLVSFNLTNSKWKIVRNNTHLYIDVLCLKKSTIFFSAKPFKIKKNTT